jgi:tRNA(Ile)-lysidine synthase
MPREQLRDGLTWARPWLDKPREDIEAYVAEHGLQHIEDESNADARYARNRLRRELWPALTQAFPGAEAALAQSAAWSQQALALADELADEDLRRWCDEGGALASEALRALSAARASNLLRAWLQRGLGHPAPASLVQRLLAEMLATASASWPAPGGKMLRLYRGRLRWVAPAASLAPPGAPLWLDLSRPGELDCPSWGGCWTVRLVEQGGMPPAALARVVLRPREGGEQFQAHAHGVPRSLKKCWQTAAVDVDARQGPLLFDDEGRLLWVPGLGFDARVCAKAGEAQLALDWTPTPSA